MGPASSKLAILEKLLNAGMNIARLNFSHGSHEDHAATIRIIREAAANTGKTVGILADIQGPKIRTGLLPAEPLAMNEGERFLLSADPQKEALPGYIYIKYPTLERDAQVGRKIYLADGMIELKVLELRPEGVLCEVVSGGELTSKKGVTFPGVSVDLPALTAKDREDIQFVVGQDVDFIAVSFARKAEHIKEIRDLVEQLGGSQLLIAKIENEEGFHNSEEILKVSDGIMVARGDLGVEVPPEEVPLIQRHLIELCNNDGKPVITATEMLESMIRNPRPTRAEVTDIAHAIFDGTDAIMLSAETAVGKHAVAAVEIMMRVANRMEDSLKYEEILARKKVSAFPTVSDAISHATCQTASDLQAVAIISSTQSGSTARMVSKYRPQAPIIAATSSERVARQLTINWGVYPVVVSRAENIDDLLEVSVAAAKRFNFIALGDLIVITAGVSTGVPGSTNLLKVHYVE